MSSITIKTLTLVLLVIPLLLMGSIGFAFLTSPPRSRPNSPWLAVVPTSQIPVDGRPVLLPVMAPRYDAWTRISDEVIDHVFARRDLVTKQIKVISAIHGRLSVPVDYDQQMGCFVSRCFGVRFDINGIVIQDRTSNTSGDDGMYSVDFKTVDNVLLVRNPKS
jgi:hypothetical protein